MELSYFRQDYFVEKWKLLSREEFEEARFRCKWMLGGKDYPWQMCHNSEKYRKLLLAEVYQILEEFDVDGFYFDGANLIPCDNVRHGCSARTSTPMIANMELWQQIRALVDSYGKRRVLLFHAWGELLPYAALAEFTLPGEQLMGQKLQEIPRCMAQVAFNSFLSGCQAVWYDSGGIRLTDETGGPTLVFQQILEGGCATWVSDYSFAPFFKEGQGLTWSSSDLKWFKRYLHPPAIFDTTGAQVHHPSDVDYHRYAQGAELPILYGRRGEWLAVFAGENGKRNGSVQINLRSLGFEGQVLVLDPCSAQVEVCSPGWVALSIREKPGYRFLRPLPERPTVIWHDLCFRRLKEAYDARKRVLRVELEGIPQTDGQLLACFPAGRKDRKQVSLEVLSVHLPEGGQASAAISLVSKSLGEGLRGDRPRG